eukprot:Opistho-2@67390
MENEVAFALQSGSTVDEGADNATVIVSRASASNLSTSITARVTISPRSQSTQGLDFNFAETNLTWAMNDSSNKTVSIRLIDDARYEASEHIIFRLWQYSSVDNGWRVVQLHKMNVLDNGDAGTVHFERSRFDVLESAGTLYIVVKRVNGSSGAAHVSIAVSAGSTANSTRYTYETTELTWKDGDATSKAISFLLVNDNVYQDSIETVVLSMVDAMAVRTTTVTGDGGNCTIFVKDDGDRGVLSLIRTSSALLASSPAINATVVRQSGSSSPVSVVVALIFTRSARSASNEIVLASQNITWNDGETGEKPVMLSSQQLIDMIASGEISTGKLSVALRTAS